VITDEAEFMDRANWGESHSGNPICTVEMESDDGSYTMEYTVVIFPKPAEAFPRPQPAAWGFVIYWDDERGANKVFGRNRYSTEERARAWAWIRLELLI
jgi:hypothetical protein